MWNLKNVSFQYPNADAYALKHVNLKFKVGEKIGCCWNEWIWQDHVY